MRRGNLVRCSLLAVFGSALGYVCPAARAADYEVTASGPISGILNDSRTFDGTTTGTLPQLVDLASLRGGSFRATYQFTQVTPEPGTTAFYELSPSSGMTSYELLDPSGVVVHRGGSPTNPIAILSNQFGAAPFTVDQVLLASDQRDVTGLRVPAPRYSQSPDFVSHADMNFSGYVGPGVNYLPDLRIPTDAATYLAFPVAGRTFTAAFEFGDGDYVDRLAPYQLVTAQLDYNITALAVTAVPEPMAACLLLPMWCALGVRRVARERA